MEEKDYEEEAQESLLDKVSNNIKMMIRSIEAFLIDVTEDIEKDEIVYMVQYEEGNKEIYPYTLEQLLEIFKHKEKEKYDKKIKRFEF